VPAGYVDTDEYFEDDDEFYVWPTSAQHVPSNFRQFYTVTRSNVLAYTFSSGAAQAMPELDLPNNCPSMWGRH
jgi:hypothetical protein